MKEIVYSGKRTIEIIEEGEYKGVKYAILNLGTHPTAYVENIVGAKEWNDEILDDIKVHGGFTYHGIPYWQEEKIGVYIGWDYAHCDDFAGYYTEADGILYNYKKWTYAEILDEVYSVIDQLLKIKGERE